MWAQRIGRLAVAVPTGISPAELDFERRIAPEGAACARDSRALQSEEM